MIESFKKKSPFVSCVCVEHSLERDSIDIQLRDLRNVFAPTIFQRDKIRQSRLIDDVPELLIEAFVVLSALF